MRLSSRIQYIITESVLKSFGNADVYLFGSRVSDSKKGGDIDIAIDVALTKEQFNQCKRQFFLTLIKFDFDFKVDIVQYANEDTLLNEEIKQTAIKLN